MNVPICTGVTALTLDSWERLIMGFGQGLWFGNRMGKSLINPNQCQKFGIKICDEPTNPHRKLGIEAAEDMFDLEPIFDQYNSLRKSALCLHSYNNMRNI